MGETASTRLVSSKLAQTLSASPASLALWLRESQSVLGSGTILFSEVGVVSWWKL